MHHHPRTLAVLISMAAALAGPVPAALGASPAAAPAPTAQVLASGLGGTVGSTVGPDGALYVADGAGGRVLRVDPATGQTSVFASGLPQRVLPLGGAMDVAFLDGRAYVLVTLVSADVGGSAVDGIYRVDGPSSFSVVADIGAYALAHPPATDYFVPSGLQFAMTVRHGSFLVTDGHHNRVYHVAIGGAISEVETFGDVVPTGLETHGRSVWLALAGPVPHVAGTGQVVSLDLADHASSLVASGAPLNVDVERAPGGALFALSQGDFPEGSDPGTPALPDTGALERVNVDGTMTAVVTGLDRPTSLEFIGHRAYVTTLTGEVYRIDLPARVCRR